MENQDKTQENEEINNSEQFKVGRANALHSSTNEPEEQDQEVEYTEEEMEFADGKGTDLADAFTDETADDEPQDDELLDDELQDDDDAEDRV